MRPGSGPYFALIFPGVATRRKELPVRRGPAGAAPHACKRQCVLGVDDPRQGIGVGCGTQIPGAGLRQLCMAHAARRARHALQPEVGCAGENRGAERGRIGVRVAPRIVRIYTLRGFESVLAGSVQPGLLGDELA